MEITSGAVELAVAVIQVSSPASAMTSRAFDVATYRENNRPVEMVRLALNGQKVTRDYRTHWKFYGPLA